jgi:hypothetical protein
MDTKSNLSHIFRQHDLSLNENQAEQTPVLKPFSLRPSANPVVASNPFAMQIDEMI